MHRLALVDLDWDVIRAVDILAALNSFKPKVGKNSLLRQERAPVKWPRECLWFQHTGHAPPLLFTILSLLLIGLLQTGAVHRVTVYPSDYGLERMADEAAHGPQVGHNL